MSSTETWTIGRLLDWTADHFRKSGSESPRLDAEILLASARGCQRIELYMAYDVELPEGPRGVFRELVRRRAAGAPVAYLVGHREFYSLDFTVTPDVLIPRPETELVVVAVLDRIKEMLGDPSPSWKAWSRSDRVRDDDAKPGPALTPALSQGEREIPVADVGTGSGAIAVAVARSCPACRVTAIDVSPAALAVAAKNVARHSVADRVDLVPSDLFAALPAERKFAIIASNPPYVSDAEYQALDRDVKEHEPRLALVAGPTGIEVIERLIEQSSGRLWPGGWLIMEISPMIAERAERLLAAHPEFEPGATLRDLAGHARVVQARRI